MEWQQRAALRATRARRTGWSGRAGCGEVQSGLRQISNILLKALLREGGEQKVQSAPKNPAQRRLQYFLKRYDANQEEEEDDDA